MCKQTAPPGSKNICTAIEKKPALGHTTKNLIKEKHAALIATSGMLPQHETNWFATPFGSTRSALCKGRSSLGRKKPWKPSNSAAANFDQPHSSTVDWQPEKLMQAKSCCEPLVQTLPSDFTWTKAQPTDHEIGSKDRLLH